MTQVDMSKITEKISELLVKMDKLATGPVELTMDYKNTKLLQKLLVSLLMKEHKIKNKRFEI